MLKIWLYALISVFIVSLISLVGVLTLAIKERQLKKILLFLVSFSAGALLGGAFIHLIPEAFEKLSHITASFYVLVGILIFFVLEKFIHWRHCHIPTSKQHPHPFAFMNLIGDGLHNLIDGMIIGASYLVSIPLGIATTVAVFLHEIPQEIGDFGVLVYGGFKKTKALFFNFLSAITAIIGAVIALAIGTKTQTFALFLLPIAAGGFIYIAGSDLIPELHKESVPIKSLIQLISLIVGIAVMFGLVFLE